MSKSLGEHEVERESYSKTSGGKTTTTNMSLEKARERVVLPSQIASLPDLTCYIAFAGNRPIGKTTVKVLKFANKTPNFMERYAER